MPWRSGNKSKLLPWFTKTQAPPVRTNTLTNFVCTCNSIDGIVVVPVLGISKLLLSKGLKNC
eukprot:2623350-Amphidinium_carterae.1